MSDESLMNPDHLKSEIHDMEELVAQDKSTLEECKKDHDRVVDMIHASYDADQNAVLSPEQVNDLIQTLSKLHFQLFVSHRVRQFHLRVYKRLLTDRRWFIAAKYLRFLQK